MWLYPCTIESTVQGVTVMDISKKASAVVPLFTLQAMIKQENTG